MKLEKQVVSLELSKKLKELGYPQEGLFWWVSTTDEFNLESFYVVYRESTNKELMDIEVVAPTVAELGEWLPFSVKKLRDIYANNFGKNAYKEWVSEYHIAFERPLHTVFGITEANSRAKMLIWLVENNYLEFGKE